jgi:hypothetical protein
VLLSSGLVMLKIASDMLTNLSDQSVGEA